MKGRRHSALGTRHSALAIASAVFVGASLIGCDSSRGDGERIVATEARELKTDGGEVVGGVTISRDDLRIGERFELTIATSASPTDGESPWRLETVDLETALGEDFFAEPVRAESGSDTKRFMIEPLLPGEYELGGLEVILRRGEDTTAARTSVPIAITVASAFAEDETPALAEARGIVDPPVEPLAWWVWASVAGGALLLLASGIGLLIWLTRVREAKPTYRTAHDLALERLAQLEASDLIGAGRLEALHDEASLILRRYIEDRFGLHAPERTTEEFLREARSSAVLTDAEVVTLEVFLRQCDMIKFARFEPPDSQAARTLETVREFVFRTKSEDMLVAFLNGRIVGRIDRSQLEKVA